jgi:23S rRNA (uridine2552-2'-O)-methyltransferase
MRPTTFLRASKAWQRRQATDPYVRRRQTSAEQYRARSAYKLIELNQQAHGFLTRPHVRSVVDLGAAPGGWSQVVARKLGWTDSEIEPFHPESEAPSWRQKALDAKRAAKDFGTWSSPLDDDHVAHASLSNSSSSIKSPKGTIIAVDLLNMAPIPGVYTLKADFLASKTASLVHSLLCSSDNPEGKADVILSDMAANVTGNSTSDTQSSLNICEAVFQFAKKHLRTAEEIGNSKGGVLVMKQFAHPSIDHFRKSVLQPHFNVVYYLKPSSSRSESSEGYFVCQGWRGEQAVC